MNNEGVGISGIGRLTGISKSSVIRMIRRIAAKVVLPSIKEVGQEYEIDEMQTYVSRIRQRIYLMYAINRITKKVIHFIVGRRTKENLKKAVESVMQLQPKKIYTDGLNIYPVLLDKDIHVNRDNKINHIERMNLTLRTHLKRFSRKSICYSKNAEMLESCIRIYLSLNVEKMVI